jgi:hypothetical protein
MSNPKIGPAIAVVTSASKSAVANPHSARRDGGVVIPLSSVSSAKLLHMRKLEFAPRRR